MMEAKKADRLLAKEVLDQFMILFSQMAAYYQPLMPGQVVPPGRSPSEPMFEKYAKLAVQTAAALARYQSPTFQAVAVAMSPGEMAPQIASRQVAEVIDINDPNVQLQAYLRMVKTPVSKGL
jgi:hypothetical protein